MYSIGNAFETFAFPRTIAELPAFGTTLKSTRDAIRQTQGLSLTAAYNRMRPARSPYVKELTLKRALGVGVVDSTRLPPTYSSG